MAAELSLDESTKDKGGELGAIFDREPYFVSGIEDAAVAAPAILALDSGAVSEPVQTLAGFHLFKALEATPAEVRPLGR